MAKDPHDNQTIDAHGQQRHRGRPRKPDALTPAERMRRYRARVKAGLVKPQTKESKRIAELEARIAELESKNAELVAANQFLAQQLEEKESNEKAGIKSIWEQSGHQCQAVKRNGSRCQVKHGLKVGFFDYRGTRYEMTVCPHHAINAIPAHEFR